MSEQINDKEKLRQALKALKMYDECMSELSCFVGHMGTRCGQDENYRHYLRPPAHIVKREFYEQVA